MDFVPEVINYSYKYPGKLQKFWEIPTSLHLSIFEWNSFERQIMFSE